jgi:hypothetical protein
MNDALADALFAEARSRHEAACRWFYIAIAGLALFQIAIFHPYLVLVQEKAEVERTITAKTLLKQEVDGIAPELARLDELGAQDAQKRLAALLAELRGTFDRLNRALEQLHQIGPDAAATAAGEKPFLPPEVPMMAQMPAPMAQMMPTPVPTTGYGSIVGLPVMAAPLRSAVAHVSTRAELVELIRPYVDGEIIEPMFDRFNVGWQREGVPALVSAAQRATQRITDARQKFPMEAEAWTRMAQAVAAIEKSASQLKAQQPGNATWWAAAEGKGATIGGFALALNDAEAKRLVALGDILQSAEAALNAGKQQQESINRKIDELKEEFRAQQAELAAKVEPLKAVSVDLAVVVQFYPLILGLVLSGVTAWRATRVEELRGIVTLISRGDRSGLAFQWLLARTGASRGRPHILSAVRCLAFIAWLSFSAWRLEAAAAFSGSGIGTLVLIGSAAILLASLYEWRIVRSIAPSATAA